MHYIYKTSFKYKIRIEMLEQYEWLASALVGTASCGCSWRCRCARLEIEMNCLYSRFTLVYVRLTRYSSHPQHTELNRSTDILILDNNVSSDL